jgi:hypothetical protein
VQPSRQSPQKAQASEDVLRRPRPVRMPFILPRGDLGVVPRRLRAGGCGLSYSTWAASVLHYFLCLCAAMFIGIWATLIANFRMCRVRVFLAEKYVWATLIANFRMCFLFLLCVYVCVCVFRACPPLPPYLPLASPCPLVLRVLLHFLNCSPMS